MQLAPPCSCSSCNHGCQMGAGFLGPGDKERIAKLLNITTKQLEKEYLETLELFGKQHSRPKTINNGKPYGRCVFYDDHQGCTVHEAKPLQCKTSMGCTSYGEDLSVWFMLNYLIDTKHPESMRQFHQYLKSGGKTLPQGNWEELIPDKKKRTSILNYEDKKQ